jgi:hypothetical protein
MNIMGLSLIRNGTRCLCSDPAPQCCEPIAVTVGVVFLVFQLRQDAKLIEASNRQIETSNRQVEANIQQNKQQVVLSTIDRFTDEAFSRKRKKVRDIIRKHEATAGRTL